MEEKPVQANSNTIDETRERYAAGQCIDEGTDIPKGVKNRILLQAAN